MIHRFTSVFAFSVGLAVALPALSDEASVKCVQEEFNALGYEAGTADGKMGAKSRNAAEKYAAFMAEKTPGWVMEPLSNDSAALWCEKVAEAWPDVAQFRQAVSPETALAETPVIFNLHLTGPIGAPIALALLKGEIVKFQADGKSGEPTISFSVPSDIVAASDRFCVLVDPTAAHFEDSAGAEFPATCDALPGTALPVGSKIDYSAELHKIGT